MLMINIPPVIGMPIFLYMHPVLNTIWCIFVCAHIVYTHSGHYLIPTWISNPKYHDDHHSKSKINFGSIYLDKLFL